MVAFSRQTAPKLERRKKAKSSTSEKGACIKGGSRKSSAVKGLVSWLHR
jgi:hypothetical protein